MGVTVLSQCWTSDYNEDTHPVSPSLHSAQSVDIPPHNYLTNQINYQLYRPEKAAEIPVEVGERRCDNSYDGGVPPCLLRPWLPPYSYSTTEVDNGEYRRKKRASRASRAWRAIFRR